jgi:hypothetical protein
MNKSEVLKRLKAAGEADPKGVTAGRAFGRKWAEETANPRQLRFVAGLVNYTVSTDEDAPPGCSAICERLAYAISDAEEWDQAEAFCKALGEGGAYLIDHEDFAIGFIKGANDVWGEVEGQV